MTTETELYLSDVTVMSLTVTLQCCYLQYRFFTEFYSAAPLLNFTVRFQYCVVQYISLLFVSEAFQYMFNVLQYRFSTTFVSISTVTHFQSFYYEQQLYLCTVYIFPWRVHSTNIDNTDISWNRIFYETKTGQIFLKLIQYANIRK